MKLHDIKYNNPVALAVSNNYGITQSLYLEKSFFKMQNTDQYFIKVYVRIDGKNICVGYIYFYLDFDLKESKFIGIYVANEFRSLGLSTSLIATWLKLCWDNNFDKISTNKRQRKPFLLYVLKKFGFEIEEPYEYQISPHTLYICKKMNSDKKYLLFKNDSQKATFVKSPVFLEDNYVILNKKTSHIPIIDQVLLSNPYHLSDYNKAVNKTEAKAPTFLI